MQHNLRKDNRIYPYKTSKVPYWKKNLFFWNKKNPNTKKQLLLSFIKGKLSWDDEHWLFLPTGY